MYGGMPTTSSEDTDGEVQVVHTVFARLRAIDPSSNSEEEDQTANLSRTPPIDHVAKHWRVGRRAPTKVIGMGRSSDTRQAKVRKKIRPKRSADTHHKRAWNSHQVLDPLSKRSTKERGGEKKNFI
jgi:hypothetical protein